jgi:peptide deformylase
MSNKPHKLVYWDNPWLRKKAEPHTEITEEVRKFVKEMIHRMISGDFATKTSFAIGLAATQIQSSYRLFVVCPFLGEDSKEKWGPPKVFINPKLIDPSDEMEIDDEGCLSFPQFYVPIARPVSITVEAQDLEGNVFKERIHGYYARQVMHENDHLNGVVFIDRLSKNIRKKIKKDLDSLVIRCSKL